MRQYMLSLPASSHKILILLGGLITAITIGYFTVTFGPIIPVAILAMVLLTVLVVSIFKNPMAGFIIVIVYCFLYFILVREAGKLPYGMGIEIILFLTWFAVLLDSGKYNWYLINNDLFYLFLIWFIISALEIFNPAGASVLGWLQEIRTSALYPVLFIPLCFILFNRNRDLNTFLVLIISLSLVAVFNGIRQDHMGLSPGEQRFLDEGGASTHLLWGKLRVFSFFNNASQFGVSQAHIGLVAFIMALGAFKWWKKLLLFIASGMLFYGMLISGTRGALFALLTGGIVALILSKNFKILTIGFIVVMSFVAVLKYTKIGDSHYEIYRLRTALDPSDASLTTRFVNQEILKDYLKSRPFGGGLGVTGYWGAKYNPGKFLASIPPDSYWVKVWVMYGVVGLIIWFGIIMYVLGKCCGIIWKIRDKKLKVKLLALCSGTAGIFFASYGNEIINDMPSAMILYISWTFIFLGPRLDQQLLSEQKSLIILK